MDDKVKFSWLLGLVATKIEEGLKSEIIKMRGEDIAWEDIDKLVERYVNIVGYMVIVEIFEKTAKILREKN